MLAVLTLPPPSGHRTKPTHIVAVGQAGSHSSRRRNSCLWHDRQRLRQCRTKCEAAGFSRVWEYLRHAHLLPSTLHLLMTTQYSGPLPNETKARREAQDNTKTLQRGRPARFQELHQPHPRLTTPHTQELAPAAHGRSPQHLVEHARLSLLQLHRLLVAGISCRISARHEVVRPIGAAWKTLRPP